LKKLLSAYGLWEVLISIVFGILLVLFDAAYFYKAFTTNTLSTQLVFSGVFINLVFLVILAASYLSKKAEAIGNDAIVAFLDMPDKNETFRFSAFSSFLSDQALGAFLATLLIVTGKDALQSYGPILSGAYAAILFLASIFLITVSLVRFISYFTKYHFTLYFVVALLSIAITFSFFQFGLKMAVPGNA
jgi:hypothetical protein